MAGEATDVLMVGDLMRVSVALIREWKDEPLERSLLCRVAEIKRDAFTKEKIIWLERVDATTGGGG